MKMCSEILNCFAFSVDVNCVVVKVLFFCLQVVLNSVSFLVSYFCFFFQISFKLARFSSERSMPGK